MAVFPKISGYKIISELGAGGVAKVYLGIQEKLNRRVAIKTLEPTILKNKVIAKRFEREAETAASLSHSNIVQIYDTGKDDGRHYIIMEYLEESLRERMKRGPEGKIDSVIALEIVKEIMKGLDYAHLKGVYHRDIKPENIMFRQYTTPVLLDFGIARVFDSSDGLTESGVNMGTAYYMSPEQCRDPKKADSKSDIYSLGVVFFEMLTGEKPYKGETQIVLALKHIEEPVPRLPKGFNRYQPLINGMMAKDKKERFSTGVQIEEMLDKILASPINSGAKLFMRIPLQAAEPVTYHPVKSEPSQKETISPDSFLEKLKNFGSFIKSTLTKWIAKFPLSKTKKILVNFVKLISKKLEELRKGVILLFRSGLIAAKDNLTLLKSYLLQKKVKRIILSFVQVILLFLVAIVFFHVGSKSHSLQDESPTKLSFNLSFVRKHIAQIIPIFQKYLNDCLHDFYEYKKDETESLRELMKLIDTLEKITPKWKMSELRERVTMRIRKLEDFDRFFSEAKKSFREGEYLIAAEYLSEARHIKDTQKLDQWNKRNHTGYRNREKDYTRLKDINEKVIREKEIFDDALSQNTEEAIRRYMVAYPSGRYTKAASLKILEFQKREKRRKRFTLRFKYEEFLNDDAIRSMLGKYDFFENKLNENGAFKSYYELKIEHGEPVVIDYTTGLMWCCRTSPKEKTFNGAKDWIDRLNKNKYGGHDDWRLPSLEEGASLLGREKNKNMLHIDLMFGCDQKRIWTGDGYSKDSVVWIVCFDSGCLKKFPTNPKNRCHIRAVRSLYKEKF